MEDENREERLQFLLITLPLHFWLVSRQPAEASQPDLLQVAHLRSQSAGGGGQRDDGLASYRLRRADLEGCPPAPVPSLTIHPNQHLFSEKKYKEGKWEKFACWHSAFSFVDSGC